MIRFAFAAAVCALVAGCSGNVETRQAATEPGEAPPTAAVPGPEYPTAVYAHDTGTTMAFDVVLSSGRTLTLRTAFDTLGDYHVPTTLAADDAVSGWLTIGIISRDVGSVSGSFDVVLASGEHLSTAFLAKLD